jgi:hypothetical protein
MNLQELSYFVAVAEHRHFGRAAQACHVSQPTLYGQSRKMEQRLGVTLFERNTWSTRAGRSKRLNWWKPFRIRRETGSRARSASERFQHSRLISCP